MQKKQKTLLLNFIFPAAVSILFAIIFKWGTEEILWGFWAASAWLSIIFCFFIAFLANPYINRAASKPVVFSIILLLGVLAFFLSYTGQMIANSAIALPGFKEGHSFYAPYVLYEATIIFFPFIILCVYEEVKNIFFSGLYTGEKFIRFFIVFARLQLIALACFFLRHYIADILLYLVVYSIAFFPIKIFTHSD